MSTIGAGLSSASMTVSICAHSRPEPRYRIMLEASSTTTRPADREVVLASVDESATLAARGALPVRATTWFSVSTSSLALAFCTW